VTLFHARVHSDGTVDYVDAGHGLGLVVRRGGGLERLASGSLPLGLPTTDPRQPSRLVLGEGDSLVCISDGVLDTLGGERAFPVVEAIVRGNATPGGAVSRILSAARAGMPIDDVTAVIVRRTAR
jgi:serine phosphatase RsbU (regulator of sigma subunit)